MMLKPRALARRLTLALALMLAVLVAGLPVVAGSSADPTTQSKTHTASKSHKTKRRPRHKSKRRSRRTRIRRRRASSRAARVARLTALRRAFVASSELRPMAQELAAVRSAAAYAGVTAYARRHTGEAAAAAYLALGHAYLIDKRFDEAEDNLRRARQAGPDLADYADFLGAEAYHQSGNEPAAEALLRGFTDRYPDSIFADEAPEFEANVLMAMNDPAAAQRVLAAAASDPAADRPGFQLAQAKVALALGRTEQATELLRQLLLDHPLSQEAAVAHSKLIALGAESSLTFADLRSLADAYYRGGRYDDAADQYRALARESGLGPSARNTYAVAAADCDLKLNRLTRTEAEALPDTDDENGAHRLYLLMELARDRDDLQAQQSIVAQMETRFPRSSWLAEALYSSGNMYLLRNDYATAAGYYGYLAGHFPESRDAPAAHWRAAWLTYRQGLYAQAAQLFDDQIRRYPSASETVSALYWRGRIDETQEHDPARAAALYRTVVRAYQHYFWAEMARQRLAALGNPQPARLPLLDRFQPDPVPPLHARMPADSPHLAKASLLANAGLNEYVAQEIAADPDASSWSALAEAQIYASYGETFRALRAIKRAMPFATTAPIRSIPLAYWRILFPEPWWNTIRAEAARNNLDPYLVASLIRQESEFNPLAISHANAYGLMQLLPSVGRTMAREAGMGRLATYQLLDPEINIRLGTLYLRHMLDKFGGVTEYALAAYNAGDNRVVAWQAAGPYQGMDEFVQSIPFTETRNYVEAILRNEQTYKEIDSVDGSGRGAATATAHE